MASTIYYGRTNKKKALTSKRDKCLKVLVGHRGLEPQTC